ncbi:nuclear transport factor 2 family protein [Larkinella soli]|uniref:nuclear transport factor 2 family protein n=1 Tax=Larkinella soli TaxID=1770527 RepID=UPI000FFBC981|nr:nuclear transport factor 2 family protein [Larkinella soli]
MEDQAVTSLIETYIQAYNDRDVDRMVSTLHPRIEFKNSSGGVVTLSLQGLDAFRAQAEEAVRYFRQRRQTVTDLRIDGRQAEALIDYRAVLAVDLPNGLKAGDTLEVQGKTVFRFQDHRIVSIEDIS